MAMMYDKYAAALYGYCHWMLDDSADAAGALQNTFVIAATTLGDLSEPSKLRPWLFAAAHITSASKVRQKKPRSSRCGTGRKSKAPAMRETGPTSIMPLSQRLSAKAFMYSPS
jgi:DNA-directed RNA polymerase specialized sigma24 family protein